MNRQSQKNKYKTFYVPDRKREGDGIIDDYGRLYIVMKGGNIRLLRDRKAETIK